MSYTSGRTVRSTRPARPTTVASATTAARKAIKSTLGDITGVTVDSSRTADIVTLAPQVRTTITFESGTNYAALQLALMSLPGVAALTVGDTGITVTRNV